MDRTPAVIDRIRDIPGCTRRHLLLGALGLALPPARARAGTTFTRDATGRIRLDVRLDDRGPFRFVLDTGAATTAVSAFLARELRLPSADDVQGHGAALSGSTGAMPVRRVRARGLEVDEVQVAGPVLAVIPGGASPRDEPDGVLGADVLQGFQVSLSFRESRARIAAQVERPVGDDAVDIVQRQGPLLALRGRLRDIPVTAILDTGAQRSIGNEALADALRLDRSFATAAVVQGIGGNPLSARQLDTPAVVLGKTRLPALPLLYADLPVFARWGLARRPALLLGMDLLGQLGSLTIDYPRGRVAITRDAP